MRCTVALETRVTRDENIWNSNAVEQRTPTTIPLLNYSDILYSKPSGLFIAFAFILLHHSNNNDTSHDFNDQRGA